MWGSWLIVLLGATVGVALLAVSLVVGASPLIAVLIVVFVAGGVGYLALGRQGKRHAEDRAVGGEALRGRDASGAPAAGEGGAPPES